MQLAVTIENKALQELVSPVYAFDPDRSPGAHETAQQALVEANPYLEELDQVPPGTVFAVPPVDGAQPSAEPRTPGRESKRSPSSSSVGQWR